MYGSGDACRGRRFEEEMVLSSISGDDKGESGRLLPSAFGDGRCAMLEVDKEQCLPARLRCCIRHVSIRIVSRDHEIV